jgi:hypothetical protein
MFDFELELELEPEPELYYGFTALWSLSRKKYSQLRKTVCNNTIIRLIY